MDKFGADANGEYNFHQTPLHLAAKNGHIEMVRLLVNFGANINAKDEEMKTPIELAAGEGHVEVVRILVAELGADVNVKDKDGMTLLHRASENGHIKMVRILVADLGADSNAQTNDGKTPLQMAASNSHIEIIRFLEEPADLGIYTRKLMLLSDLKGERKGKDDALQVHWLFHRYIAHQLKVDGEAEQRRKGLYVANPDPESQRLLKESESSFKFHASRDRHLNAIAMNELKKEERERDKDKDKDKDKKMDVDMEKEMEDEDEEGDESENVDQYKWIEDAITHKVITLIPFQELRKERAAGLGTYGTVYKATWKEEIVAIKEYASSEDLVHDAKVFVLLGTHENIIQIYGITK